MGVLALIALSNATAALVQLPDIVVTETGEVIQAGSLLSGVDLNSTGLSIGNLYSEPGGVIAAEGDILRITIRPEAGKQFSVANGFLVFQVSLIFALDKAPPSIGLPIEQNSVNIMFDGITGGSMPVMTTLNSFYESPAPTGAPLAFAGALVSQSRVASIVPFDLGGDVVFDSVTIEMENLIPLDWDDLAFEQLLFRGAYPLAGNTEGVSIIGIPEPSVSILFSASLLGFCMMRRR